MDYLSHIETIIEEIKSIDFLNSWSYEQALHSFLKIKSFPVVLHPFLKGNMIFRSRPNDNSSKYEKITDISHPATKYVTDYARANKPRQSLFYGSENRPTSYMEFADKLSMQKSAGDKFSITVGGWKVQQDLTLALVLNPFDKSDNQYNKYYGKGFDEFVEKSSPSQKEGILRLFNFIAEEYAKPFNDKIGTYLITCAYSNIILGIQRCDGIIYPSVQNSGNSFNVVLKRSVVEQDKIILETVGRDTFMTGLQDNGKHSFTQIDNESALNIDYERNQIKWK